MKLGQCMGAEHHRKYTIIAFAVTAALLAVGVTAPHWDPYAERYVHNQGSHAKIQKTQETGVPKAASETSQTSSAKIPHQASISINNLVLGAVPGANVVTTFPGPYDLTGVVIKDSKGVTIGWTNRGHDYFILGSVISPKAKNLTVLAISTLKSDLAKNKSLDAALAPTASTASTSSSMSDAPSPTSATFTPSASATASSTASESNTTMSSTDGAETTSAGLIEPNIQKALQRLNLSSVEMGYGPIQITAFIDPNCSYCHKFYESLTSIPDWKSKYSVLFVPVAIVNSTSKGKADAILSAGDSSALIRNENLFGSTGGGVSPVRNKKSVEVDLNTAKFMALTKVLHLKNSVPLIIHNTHIYQFNVSSDFLEKMYN